MLILETYNFRLVQDGPRSYHSEHWEHQRWWRSGVTELLDTYPGTVEQAMTEDWEAITNPKVETVEELRARFEAEFGGEDWFPGVL
jgi:hypothetical protein